MVFQRYDLSRAGLVQLPDNGRYPTLHDRLFGIRLAQRYALELAACAGQGYAHYGRGTVLVMPLPGPRPADVPYQLKMHYLPLLRLVAIMRHDISIVELCNAYDPVTSYVLSPVL